MRERSRGACAAYVRADDDLGIPEADLVPVGQLPLLHRGVVYSGAVGGVEVRQQGRLAVPPDLEVATRDTRVGQPELCVLSPADDVGALPQLVGAATAVVELERDVGVACGPVVVLAVAAGRVAALAVLVLAGLGSAIPARRVVAAIVGLAVLGLAVLGLPVGLALLLIATLFVVAVAGAWWFGSAVAGTFVPSRCGRCLTAVVAPVTGLAAIAGRGTLRVRLFVTARGAGGSAAVTLGGRTLVVLRRVALWRVAALLGRVAAARRVSRLTLRRVAALLGRVAAL